MVGEYFASVGRSAPTGQRDLFGLVSQGCASLPLGYFRALPTGVVRGFFGGCDVGVLSAADAALIDFNFD